jgi:hypothetical protein
MDVGSRAPDYETCSLGTYWKWYDVTGMVGQNIDWQSGGFYGILQLFIGLDTSGIPDAADVAAATLRLYPESVAGLTDPWGVRQDFTVQARLYDYGDRVNTYDFQTPSQLNDLPLLGGQGTAGAATGAAFDIVFDEGQLGYVNKTGLTKIVLCSDRNAANTAPIPPRGQERLTFYVDQASGLFPQLLLSY